MDEPNGGPVDLTIRQVLSRLPAFEDDLYLGMQATNLDIVDGQLRNLEEELLQVYIKEERTPVPEAVFVSALSQLWIFGLYEILRTWRQRLSDLLAFSETLSTLSKDVKSQELEKRRKEFENRSPYLNDTPRFRFEPYQRMGIIYESNQITLDNGVNLWYLSNQNLTQ